MREFKIGLAYLLASIAHKGQKDKGGQPYMDHVLRVMCLAKGYNERVVSLLHDTIEDTWVTKKIINFIFGKEIAEAVDVLTKRAGEDYFSYIGRVQGNPLAKKVKINDLNDNFNALRLLPEDQNSSVTKKRLDKYAKALRVLKG